MEKSGTWGQASTHYTSEARRRVCSTLMCPLCAASAKRWWQGAPESVRAFAQPFRVCLPGSTRLGSKQAATRIKCTLWKRSAHTLGLQRSAQGVGVVCSQSLCPAGKAKGNRSGLAVPGALSADWWDLRKSSIKAFYGETPSTVCGVSGQVRFLHLWPFYSGARHEALFNTQIQNIII